MSKSNFDPQRHVYATYKAIRYGMAGLAFLLPIFLAVTGISSEGYLRGSWSAYYYGPLYSQEIFVGVLCAIGAFLIFYTGMTRTENVLLCVAGGFAIMVAFVPMNACEANGYCVDPPNAVSESTVICTTSESSASCRTIRNEQITTISVPPSSNALDIFKENVPKEQRKASYTIQHCISLGGISECQRGPLEYFNGKVSLHGIAAFLFFSSVAAVCLFCTRKTLQLIEDEDSRASYRLRYNITGGLMIALPAFVVLLTHLEIKTFIAETLAAWLFSYYWVTKTKELSESRAELLAMSNDERVGTIFESNTQ